ncbi:MAG: TetR family transcriptional regulator [Myxococcales bacterium]|nr:TetR family transcriptional regulator [Myxococcales bacterium]
MRRPGPRAIETVQLDGIVIATQAQRSAATKAALLEATIACVIAHGYQHSTTAEICRRAGVSKGAQLHHYPTKAELVAAAVEHLFSRRLQEFRAAVAAVPPGRDALDAALETLWQIYSGPTLAAWIELVAAARSDETLRRVMADVDVRFAAEAERAFVELFGGELPVGAAAPTRLVMSMFDGLALMNVLRPADPLPRQVIALLRALIEPWRAAAPRKPKPKAKRRRP